MSLTDLSLFHLDGELTQLLSLREEMAAIGEDTAAIETEIKAYLQQLPVKVSGVCAIFRLWKSQRVTIDLERERLKRLAEQIESREERLKAYVADVLEAQPEPRKGPKKLTGADGSSLSLRGNGGVQPLDIADPLMLPAEYLDVRLKMPLNLWQEAVASMPPAMVERMANLLALEYEVQEPSNSRIREALEQPCPDCEGKGFHQAEGYGDETCETCKGDGRQGVPGCSLLPRGKSVVIA